MQTKVFGRRDFIAFYEVIVKIPVRFEAAKLNFDFFSDGTLSSFLERLFTGPSAQR